MTDIITTHASIPTDDTTAAAAMPPAWASGPDPEGSYGGPSGGLPALLLDVNSGWYPNRGGEMWLDCAAARGLVDLTPAQARSLAADLIRIADLVDDAGEEPMAARGVAPRPPAPRPAPRSVASVVETGSVPVRPLVGFGALLLVAALMPASLPLTVLVLAGVLVIGAAVAVVMAGVLQDQRRSPGLPARLTDPLDEEIVRRYRVTAPSPAAARGPRCSCCGMFHGRELEAAEHCDFCRGHGDPDGLGVGSAPTAGEDGSDRDADDQGDDQGEASATVEAVSR